MLNNMLELNNISIKGKNNKAKIKAHLKLTNCLKIKWTFMFKNM